MAGLEKKAGSPLSQEEIVARNVADLEKYVPAILAAIQAGKPQERRPRRRFGGLVATLLGAFK